MRAEAAELDVLKVAIRPGEPLTMGRLGTTLYVGLPGNPYAAAITDTQVARPALRRVAGLMEEPGTWLPAVAGFTYSRPTGRHENVSVTWSCRNSVGRPVVMCLGQRASASTAPMAQAMWIAILPPEPDIVTPGQPLMVAPLCEWLDPAYSGRRQQGDEHRPVGRAIRQQVQRLAENLEKHVPAGQRVPVPHGMGQGLGSR